MNDCVFCKIIAGDLPAQVISESDTVIVFLALENHPMIVPKIHYNTIYELDEDMGAEIMRETIRITKATKIALRPDGINLVQSNEKAAQQDGSQHFHIHVKPRWFDDGVTLNWSIEPVEERLRIESKDRIIRELAANEN